MNQCLKSSVIVHHDEVWHQQWGGATLAGRGDKQVLVKALTAFFASRRCPGVAIRAAMDWALRHARSGQPVIGGFHSPLECSVLELLLEAHSPVVAVLARPVAYARWPRYWKRAIEEGNLVVVSTSESRSRLTGASSAARNNLIAMLANSIVITHADPQGILYVQAQEWFANGKPVQMLDVPPD